MEHISKNAVIAKTVILHENVVIQDGAVLHDYVVVYPDTVVESGVEVFDHAILGRAPRAPSGTLKRPTKQALAPLVIGANTVIGGNVVLYRGSTVGPNCLFGDGASVREECSIGSGCVIGRNVSVNYHTQIGNDTKVMDNSIITGNMKIGNHVFISNLVSTSNDNALGTAPYSDARELGPTVQDGVRIGAAAVILPYVTLEEGAVIAAGSIVTHDVPKNTLVMGAPARVVRDI